MDHNKSDKFKEQILYYFESKINYLLFEKENLQTENFFSNLNLNNITRIISFLENNNNNNLIILFYIAYLKVIFKQYINLINERPDLNKEDLNKIFENKSKKKFIDSLSYYILKLYYDIDVNLKDFISSNHSIQFSDDIVDRVNSINTIENYYGFEYLFLPMKKEYAKKYNEIIKIIINSLKQENLTNDLGIVSDINKNDIDTFYCIISNLFLSHFHEEDYFNSNNYSILKNWFEEKINQNKFTILNDYTKEILNIFINLEYANFAYNKDLLYLLFALRLVLNSLSSSNSSFFFKLIVNPKEIISTYQNVFKYFFNNKTTNFEKIESFKLLRFILLSHLLFSCKLGNINLQEIANAINITFEEGGKMFDILNEEFDSVIKIIRFKGIKVKYIIIYMNIVFEEIKSIKEFGKDKPESNVKYLENIITSEFYYKEIKKYFNLLKENGISEDNNEFIKILFEDYELYNSSEIDKIPYLKYFTTPNLCTLEDFEVQYKSSMEIHPIIECLLNKNENEIFNIMNCLRKLNLFINNIYNEKVLSISREEAEEETIEELNLNDKLSEFNENITKLQNYFEIETLTDDSKLLKILNIKDNEIYKLYNNIIQKFNKFISKLSIYNTNKEFLLPLLVQDYSKEISLFENPEEGLRELLKIICIYSKRNRLITDDKNYKLNIYSGDKIDYDFQLIENILENKFFIDKNIFEQNQRTFIFSNNVFSDERNNLLAEIMDKFPQKKLKENLESDPNNKENNIEIYHNLQFIIIHLKSLSIYCRNENIPLKDISEMLSKKLAINSMIHLILKIFILIIF